MNFDRVASIYDSTRGMPSQITALITDRILLATEATPETRFIELGVGTGRIALPIVARGHRYTGIDISDGMMAQLRTKAASGGGRIDLIGADVTELPLQDNTFDVAIVVHLLHLVPDWRKALGEARRITVPHGYFLMGNDAGSPGSPGSLIRKQWATFVQGMGANLRPEYGTWDSVEEALTESGCRTAVYRVASWDTEIRPLEVMENQRDRTYSQSWEVPDEILLQVHEEMLRWGKEQFGDIDAPLRSRVEFLLSVSRWPD